MFLTPELQERLNNIQWFANCGQPFHLALTMPTTTVASWQEASHFYHLPDWEATTLEARNVLTRHLSARYRQRDADWNKITIENKAFLESQIEPKLLQVQERFYLDQTFVGCVKWDVLAATMEYAYLDCDLPIDFFRELLRVYEAGHFPCGWIGEWPNGKLVVL